jgi:hypothetical protein
VNVISELWERKEEKRYGEIPEDDCPIPEEDGVTRGTELDLKQMLTGCLEY